MKKITIIIMISLCLMSVVSALQIGQVITQSQLNNQDIFNADLKDSFLRENNKIVHNRQDDNEIFYVVLNSIQPETAINNTNNETYLTGNYVIVNVKKRILVDIERWVKRKTEVGLQQAKAELKDWLIAKKERLEQEEKALINSYKTDTNNLEEFNLDDLEI